MQFFSKRQTTKPGERVLDVGCGGGTSTIVIADTVAPEGKVGGIDILPDLTIA
ncbi:methyltransferase domain-containing protein [Aurantiacibacter atlanticus]|uniref:methyltransferase domain-containing protein n=1 Tax=Aurantiacibacter atlanticus TaxID=1648404 RepID=UPI001372E958